MTAATPRKPLTIAVQPNARGFGWAAFEGPFAIHEWDLVIFNRDKNAKCLERIEALFARLLPDTLCLEAFGPEVPRRTERVRRLCKGIVALAMDRGIDVAIYTRDQVRSCFADLGARTRVEIAHAVARHHAALGEIVPKRRQAWDSEDHRLAVFSAAALVLTHYQLGARTLFDALG